VRFVFAPPAQSSTGLLTLPWREPVETWTDERIVEIRQRGISRHVVRFVADDGQIYAVKELDERLARKEYRLLRALADLGIPAVEVLGVVVDRPDGVDAALVTQFLDHSISYRALFANPRGGQPTDKLLDALVELLARLHLAGFYWGDCSLSNTLFRLDAGALAAYLVDAETSELYPNLSVGQRGYDVELAAERVGGELFDLQAGGLLPADIDPVAVAEEIPARYSSLWNELTREDTVRPSEQRYKIAQRLKRLNELGFDVDEVELIDAGDGNKLRLRTRVAEPGHHRRLLFTRTGLVAQENQARRLLNDIASYRSHLERTLGRPVPEAVAANRWLTEVYDPVVSAIPAALRDRLDEVEVFHEILEHRWFLSEAAGRDIGTTAARNDYFAKVLPTVPDDLTITAPPVPAQPSSAEPAPL
jgi:tRNA A-37 threonylcarbamoyl transferase component Bud32